MPVIVPFGFNINPAGSMVPPVSDHVYGGTPPVAVSCVDGYAVPTVPSGREVVVIFSNAVGSIVMVIVLVSVGKAIEVAVIVTVNFAATAVVGAA